MKTLIIHPSDPTTDFLKIIYENKDWTVINDNISNSLLKEQIKNHDRIIMMGHGCELGLFGYKNRLMISSKHIYLLREKKSICIWCNADVFVKKYNLKGLYTGMIISDLEESYLYSISASLEEIEESNNLFAKSIKESIDQTDPLGKIKKIYKGDADIINFNKENIYLS